MRLFVALFPRAGAVQPLLEAAQRTASTDQFRWVAPARIHLTLLFVGETDDPGPFRAAVDATRRCYPEPLHAQALRVGPFPRGRRPRVLALHLQCEKLVASHDMLAEECRRRGLAFDSKPFKPHITLAYCKRGGGHIDWDRFGALVPPNSIELEPITLVESQQGPGGATYRALS